jgi:acylphosphatase
MERREIYFSGRVQGVGFRFTTRAIAQRMPVVGFVENLRDARVLLVVEGTPDTLDRLVAAIDAELNRYIESVDIQVRPTTGEFTTFEIRR